METKPFKLSEIRDIFNKKMFEWRNVARIAWHPKYCLEETMRLCELWGKNVLENFPEQIRDFEIDHEKFLFVHMTLSLSPDSWLKIYLYSDGVGVHLRDKNDRERKWKFTEPIVSKNKEWRKIKEILAFKNLSEAPFRSSGRGIEI